MDLDKLFLDVCASPCVERKFLSSPPPPFSYLCPEYTILQEGLCLFLTWAGPQSQELFFASISLVGKKSMELRLFFSHCLGFPCDGFIGESASIKAY